MPTTPKPPPSLCVKRRWRWLRRLLGLAFLLILGVAGLAWWAWRNPAYVLQQVFERVEGPFAPTVAEVNVDRSGLLVLKDFTLQERGTSRSPLKVDRVEWRFDVSEAVAGRYGKVALQGVKLDVDREQVAKVQEILAKMESAPSSSPGVMVDSIELKSAQVRLAETEFLPALEFTVDRSSGGLDLRDPVHPVVKDFKLDLSNVLVAGNAIPSATMEGALNQAGRLDIVRLTLKGVRLAPTAALLRYVNQAAVVVPGVSAAPATPVPSVIKEVHVGRIELEDFALEGAGEGVKMPRWWPLVRGRASCTLSDLTMLESGELSLGAQRVDLHEVELSSTTGRGRIYIPKALVRAAGTRANGVLHVVEARLEKPVIEWTQGLEDDLFPTTTTGDTPPAQVTRMRGGIDMESLSVVDASLSVTRTRKVEYEGQVRLDLQLRSLLVDGNGISSLQKQDLDVRQLSLAQHSRDREVAFEPFAVLERGRLSVVPNALLKQSTVAELTLTKPVVKVHSENVSWFDAKPEGTPVPAPSPTEAGPSWVSRLNFQELSISDGMVDYAAEHVQRVEVRSRLAVSTQKGLHCVRLEKVQGMLPQHAKLPVAGIDLIEATFQMPALWQTRRIDSLSITGGELEVGDALMAFSTPSEENTTPEVSVKPEPGAGISGWRMSEITIKDTAITLQRIAPGLPPVKFDLNYHAYDLPLAPEELAGNFEPQRIELSQLAIKSPYESLRNVAFLPTAFVDFTLDGLFQQRISKVEIVSPSLFVGEDLFWYVDYYRKYAAGETLPNAPSARIASTGKLMAFEAAASAAVAPVKEVGTWSVETLQVHGGKLIIAPKGRPLPGIPRPFPFSFTTRMDQGKLEAQFDIPSDTYTWEELKLQLEGMRGRVMFNLPVKTVDNNLTETFLVDRIRYKQLHMEKGHLTVTYDANGIYGKFGGEAYEGYVNGAFNIYNDTNYSWDGWVSGAGVKTTEITQKMCPAYLLLDGKVDATVVAQGNTKEIYQCDVKFKNTTPGKFSVVALNDMLAALPTDLAGYQQDMVKIGIETLRDLDYHKAEAQARFYGREGKGFLHIEGPEGTRHIDINVYDHRMPAASPIKIQVSSSASP